MIQGTAPIQIFNLSVDTNTLKEIRVLYAQNDTLVLKKTTEDCILDGKTVQVKLTQEETFLFDASEPYTYQLRALTLDGEPLATVPKQDGITRCLDNEVLE